MSMAGNVSALHSFVTWVTTVKDDDGNGSGGGQQAKVSWIKQRAISALAEYDRVVEKAAAYRVGRDNVPGELGRFVYAAGASPSDSDVYLFDAGDRGTAELVVAALNRK